MINIEQWSVEIVTENEGKPSIFRAIGLLDNDENGVFVRYTDGAALVKFYVGERARMVRSGDYTLDLLFENKKTTIATMALEGQKATFPLQTKEYHYKITQDQMMVFVKYVLKFESGDQNMKVKFKAQQIKK